MANRKLYVELYDRLKANVRADYEEIKSNFDINNLEESCLKITTCKTFADDIIYDHDNAGTDVAMYLYYKKLVTAFYDWCINNDFDLREHFEDTVGAFISNIRRTIYKIVENQNDYTKEEVEKALEIQKWAEQISKKD